MEDIKEQREQIFASRRLSASILARMETYELKQAIKRVINKTSSGGQTMAIKRYKYIVKIEGLEKSMEYFTYHAAIRDIEVFMPCKATIEAKEV